MPARDGLRRQLLKIVPDEPVWIEVRAALLDPGCRLFGDPQGFVVRSDRLRLGGVGGDAREPLIREALGDIGEAGSDPTALWAVIVPHGAKPAVRSALPAWRSTEAEIFREPERGMSPAHAAPQIVRSLLPEEASLLSGLPGDLRSELVEALGRCRVAAAWADDRPVSFCYVACESERLWDISINTAQGYRRRGLAASCVAWLTAEMRKRGKRAVWGAHCDNVASRRLARKLGFEFIGRLQLFENWEGSPS